MVVLTIMWLAPAEWQQLTAANCRYGSVARRKLADLGRQQLGKPVSVTLAASVWSKASYACSGDTAGLARLVSRARRLAGPGSSAARRRDASGARDQVRMRGAHDQVRTRGAHDQSACAARMIKSACQLRPVGASSPNQAQGFATARFPGTYDLPTSRLQESHFDKIRFHPRLWPPSSRKWRKRQRNAERPRRWRHRSRTGGGVAHATTCRSGAT